MSKHNTSIERKVGLRIRALRNQRNMTQTELGQKAGGIAAAEVSKFENARRSPSLESLQRIAEALDMQLHELVDMTPPNTADVVDEAALQTFNERLRGATGAQIHQILGVIEAMLQHDPRPGA